MLLTLFLAIVFCAAITLMLLSAVAFIQDKKFFSSAPKEAQEVLLPRDHELFFGARTMRPPWYPRCFTAVRNTAVSLSSERKLQAGRCSPHKPVMKIKSLTW